MLRSTLKAAAVLVTVYALGACSENFHRRSDESSHAPGGGSQPAKHP